MPQLYDRAFFDWVRLTAVRSAEAVLPVVVAATGQPASVVDVGCGEGAWLSVWMRGGVTDVTGLDGAYIDPATLLIPTERFVAADLARPLAVARRFALVQSLEVAEHLPPASSAAFVAGLCALGDIVLFSAAQPGQGGENHINEQRPSAWAALFRHHGYAAFDAIRPALREAAGVAPWYRFNMVLYANPDGQRRLSPAALGRRSDDLADFDRGGDLAWRMRRLVLRPLPVPAVSWLSRMNYKLACARQRRAETSRLRAVPG